MQLFKCKTIPQFKIQKFLAQEGFPASAVGTVDFPAYNSVRITDFQGSTLTVTRSGPGAYEFSYLINGDASHEIRYDKNERVGSGEAPE